MPLLIMLLLTLCPPLAIFYMARCMAADARDVIKWADARHPDPPQPAPTPEPPVDDRPVYHAVELEPRLVALMKRDGYL